MSDIEAVFMFIGFWTVVVLVGFGIIKFAIFIEDLVNASNNLKKVDELLKGIQSRLDHAEKYWYGTPKGKNK